jgi:hypothetical protein
MDAQTQQQLTAVIMMVFNTIIATTLSLLQMERIGDILLFLHRFSPTLMAVLMPVIILLGAPMLAT